MLRKAIAPLVLVAETAIAAYLALIVWLLTSWMIDDFQAFRMAASDWYIEAAWRFVAGLLVGLVFGGMTYLVNRRWVSPRLPESPRLGSRTAIALAMGIVLSGAAGAIGFAITKPFM